MAGYTEPAARDETEQRAELTDNVRRLFDLTFNDFHRFRGSTWPELRRARKSNSWTADMARVHDGIALRSTIIEEELGKWLAALKLNLTRVDAVSLDKSQTAKREVEKIRKQAAAKLRQYNEGRKLDDHIYTPMVLSGVSALWKGWQQPPEPSDEDLGVDYDGIDDADPEADDKRAARLDKAREAWYEGWYADERNDCFPWQPVAVNELAWEPLDKPCLFVQRSLLSVHTAQRYIKPGGRRIKGVAQDNSLIYSGGTEPTREDMPDGRTPDAGKEVEYIRQAELDDDTGYWVVTEWLRGTDKGASVKADNQQQYELFRRTVCPYKRAPYLLAEAGTVNVTEVDPHLRYRPPLYHLYVDIDEYNGLMSYIVALAISEGHDDSLYESMARTNPEVLTHWRQESGLGETPTGETEAGVLRMPERQSGDIVRIAGQLAAIPRESLIRLLEIELQEVKERIAGHRINRFLVGDATPQDLNSPATAVLNASQAASTPIAPFISNHDDLLRRFLLAEEEAFCTWDEDSELKRPFVIRTRGDEPALRASIDAGDIVTTTADTFKNPHDLIVITDSETDAERAQRHAMADADYAGGMGSMTREDWLRAKGSPDPQETEEQLYRDRVARENEADMAQMRAQFRRDAILMFGDGLVPPELAQVQGQPGQQPPASGQDRGLGYHLSPAPIGDAARSASGVAP